MENRKSKVIKNIFKELRKAAKVASNTLAAAEKFVL